MGADTAGAEALRQLGRLSSSVTAKPKDRLLEAKEVYDKALDEERAASRELESLQDRHRRAKEALEKARTSYQAALKSEAERVGP